jgi:hypothetical protein
MSAGPLDDLLTQGEADTGSFDTLSVKPFEYAEYLSQVLRLYANSIVVHSEKPMSTHRPIDADSNVRGDPGARILDGVGDEILKQLSKMNFRHRNSRQVSRDYLGPALFNG